MRIRTWKVTDRAYYGGICGNEIDALKALFRPFSGRIVYFVLQLAQIKIKGIMVLISLYGKNEGHPTHTQDFTTKR